jgi:hypothetical protein
MSKVDYSKQVFTAGDRAISAFDLEAGATVLMCYVDWDPQGTTHCCVAQFDDGQVACVGQGALEPVGA